jgi:beta-glucanase (GH16 family)
MLGRRLGSLASWIAIIVWVSFVDSCGTTYGDPIYQGAAAPTDAGPSLDAASWQIVFQDDFTGTALDRSQWNTDWWWGRIKDDDASYFADTSVTFADGLVSLQISKTPASGLDYTSGIITTYQKFSFRYGKVEVRAKTPHLGNLVIDLLAESTAWPPEIGVVASEMARPDRVYFWNTPALDMDAAAMTDDASGTGVGSADLGRQPSFFTGPDFTADFHIFEAEWSPGLIVWKVDGVERHSATSGVPEEDMYVVLAVQMDRAAVPGGSPAPSDAEIDYVRISQQK